MTQWVALLYSVVLTAERRVTSADLLGLADEIGGTEAKTVLSTGNLIFRATGQEAGLGADIETALARRLGRPIPVLLRSAEGWRALAAANPFPAETAGDPARVAVRVMRAPVEDAVRARIACAVGPGERFAATDRALWLATIDRLSSTALHRAIAAPWAGIGTMRNASAVAKIAAMLDSR